MIKVTPALIEGFVGSVLAKNFDAATAIPEFHKELWAIACSDKRYVAVAAPRNHAKTTAGTVAYTLCMLLFRNASYCMIVSDTETQATMFLSLIKQELQTNPDIADFFGLVKDDKGVKFTKDTETIIEVPFTDGHKFRIVVKGAEQSMRGIIWNHTRPDLIICDDMENDELVMNKERREKLKRWFESALVPAGNRTVKIRYWGTILHISSLLESMMPSYTSKTTVYEGLKMYSTDKKKWFAVKFKAHNEDLTEFLWPERYDKAFFTEIREDLASKGMLDVYSQEYLNYPIDDSVAFYRKGDLLPITERDEESALRYYITVDLAISLDEKADYSVFVVGGVDENRNIQVVNIIRDRMDALEIVETIFQLDKHYRPEAIGIEKMQISQAIGPFLREEMHNRNQYPMIHLMSHMNKDKTTRGRSMQGRVRARTVKFDKEADWYPQAEEELTQFPRSRNDDIADAFAYLGLLLDVLLEAPTVRELQEEEDELEFNVYREQYGGRSRFTGY
jgi:predicted phage terminase large subunit-like protein